MTELHQGNFSGCWLGGIAVSMQDILPLAGRILKQIAMASAVIARQSRTDKRFFVFGPRSQRRGGCGITNSIIGIAIIVTREEQVIGSIYLDDRWPFTYFPIGIPSILPSFLGRNTFAGSLLLNRLEVLIHFGHKDAVAVDEANMVEVNLAIIVEEHEGVNLTHLGGKHLFFFCLNGPSGLSASAMAICSSAV